MTLKDLSYLRLSNQLIHNSPFSRPLEVVEWMGAIQAQDYAMSKWAIGIRSNTSTEEVIQSAIDAGQIVRTHVLRPTWHLVSSKNISWMLQLTAPRIKASMKSRHKELELDDALLTKCKKIIAKALEGNNHLTRDELMSKLKAAKISTDGQRAAHIMFIAELDRLVCNGKMKGKEHTYALFEERITHSLSYSEEEALARLAELYFTSHGPATIPDFSWWSGLNLTDARKGLEMVKSQFKAITINEQAHYYSEKLESKIIQKPSVFLLPAYDEFLISYKDRSASLAPDHQKKTISNNGIFYPVIVVNGQVEALWKRTIKKDKVVIEIKPLPAKENSITLSIQKAINQAAEHYKYFLKSVNSIQINYQ
ncbi:MAG TPA: winged helix DNA-binding domain-containing protein [Cytophagaceae bacterium]